MATESNVEVVGKTNKTLKCYNYVSPLQHVASLWPTQLGNLSIKIISEFHSCKHYLRGHSCGTSNYETHIYDNCDGT